MRPFATALISYSSRVLAASTPKWHRSYTWRCPLLPGTVELTNEPNAITKIAGIKLCESHNRQNGDSHGEDHRSFMPTDLYGTGDDHYPENSHVIPALIRRFHEARQNNPPGVTIWGMVAP